MRLSRKQSINQREDFLRIRKTGQAKAGRFVIVSTLADPALGEIRAAFVTSKRAAKKAHDRNRIRRRLRACLQEHAENFSDQKRYLVTIAKPGSGNADFSELKADWLKQCRRLGLLGH